MPVRNYREIKKDEKPRGETKKEYNEKNGLLKKTCQKYKKKKDLCSTFEYDSLGRLTSTMDHKGQFSKIKEYWFDTPFPKSLQNNDFPGDYHYKAEFDPILNEMKTFFLPYNSGKGSIVNVFFKNDGQLVNSTFQKSPNEKEVETFSVIYPEASEKKGIKTLKPLIKMKIFDSEQVFHFDGLGRKVYLESGTPQGVLNSGKTFYGQDRSVLKQTIPFFEDESVNQNDVMNEKNYDGYGRLKGSDHITLGKTTINREIEYGKQEELFCEEIIFNGHRVKKTCSDVFGNPKDIKILYENFSFKINPFGDIQKNNLGQTWRYDRKGSAVSSASDYLRKRGS
ncbi:MAG: hypothetical protein VXW15_04625, partial [Bdellovibrionota bacterium]|nr:hypothetical protein [Bdellovibrionota bacterium]